MKGFMKDDFLLENDTAKLLWKSVKDLPILDYHCHIRPEEVSEDKIYENITEAWLKADHYKWRAMRNCGVDEEYITGNKSDFEKFQAYANIIPLLIGNPLYHWTHLELKTYFGIEKPLNADTAKEIFDLCNDKLSNLATREIIKMSNVELICTTDDPDDNLENHIKLRNDNSFTTHILPTFRPDRLLKNADMTTLKHLEKRLDYFVENGCKLSDHGVYNFDGDTKMLLEVAKMYKERNIVMQLHYGVHRNPNTKMFEKLGADSGYDVIGNSGNPENLISFLDSLDKIDKLPKTILYSINPSENLMLSTIAGSYRDMKHGSAWWFNDTKTGMEAHMKDLASVSSLGKFLGMLTDSRSFLSYTRHEYFRRILCNYVGNLVEKGEYPNDTKALEMIVKNVSYYNCKDYLNI